MNDLKFKPDIESNISLIKDMFKNDDTLISREFEITVGNENKAQRCCAFFIDGMIDKKILTESIIKPLVDGKIKGGKNEIDEIVKSIIYAGEVRVVSNISDVEKEIIYGSTAVFFDDQDKAVIVDTIGWEKRGVTEPQSETVVKGPKEGFTESISVNLSLVRKRIRTSKLKFKFIEIGEKTKTKVCVSYIEGTAKENIINEVFKRLGKIKIDGVLDSGYINEMIKDSPHSICRTVGSTERPDIIAGKLLEGRVALFCDGSPMVLTVPYIFVENFQSDEDYYNEYIFASINRILRYISFFLGTSVPALYVGITTFHQEIIPTSLLLSIASARREVPFPTIVETFGMLIVFEILREAGLRMPKPIGQAVSIVGALVLGDAAVNARIVSAPIVIITAITGICSFMIPNFLGIIVIRSVLLILSSIIGIYGYTIGVFMFSAYLFSIKSFGVPYMTNVTSFSADDMKDTAVRASWGSMNSRPKFAKDLKRKG